MQIVFKPEPVKYPENSDIQQNSWL